MRRFWIGLCGMAAALVFLAGCHSKTVDKAELKSALNNYYSSQQVCLWPTAVKFPAQADTNNENQTKGFDALTDAGLLTRMPAEKKRFLIGSKQVNNYDLSDKGRSHWTADAAQPGYGNFCFGHPEVNSIDSISPDTGGATQYAVSYHDAVSVPDWADTAEIKTAFPSVTTQSSGQAATATLVKSNNGWQVQNVSPSSGVPAAQ
ncbi:MAG TPA: hypothetical protein VL991_10580 [Terracidiphilus sp.]|nr:hypothetical protein [Terracidiphilus sp.]